VQQTDFDQIAHGSLYTVLSAEVARIAAQFPYEVAEPQAGRLPVEDMPQDSLLVGVVRQR
jgi:hypothetical protein